KAAADRADGEERKPEIERRLAADHVGDRAISDLADAEGDEERHQRRLRRRDGGVEIRGDRRQRREIHIDRERSDSAEQAEDDRVLRESGEHDNSGLLKARAAGSLRPRLGLCAAKVTALCHSAAWRFFCSESFFRSARPCSNCLPTIFSQLTKTLINFPR